MELKTIYLPFSKSIVSRILMQVVTLGFDLHEFSLSSKSKHTFADDNLLLYNLLNRLKQDDTWQDIDVQNCGTAMRFLTAYIAAKEGYHVMLYGNERMAQRPVGQLVEALRTLGADISYVAKEGYPPLKITGKNLKGGKVRLFNADSTQYISALKLVSKLTEQAVQIAYNSDSKYIKLTDWVIQTVSDEWIEKRLICSNTGRQFDWLNNVETDWSAAAFMYEYVALHRGVKIMLPKLKENSLQPDSAVAEIYSHLGVSTVYTPAGVLISSSYTNLPESLIVDFALTPDIYPPLYATCKSLGVKLLALNTACLRTKESDRVAAMSQFDENRVIDPRADHRIAMAALCADRQVADSECISKSFPNFMEQWRTLSA